ncbi:MAG: M28 family peptidase [Proteobacteria bacterium]|nr:M28 family peptidase [Pseudomonadota bacterium]
MPERDILEELSVESVRAHVVHITETMPGRLAGTPAAERMAAYSATELGKAGLEAEVRAIPGLVSFPEPGALEVLAPRRSRIVANTLGHSRNTPAGGLDGELVYVGSGGYDDFAGKEVKGKIVLCELSYVPGRHEKQRIAAEKGAIGAVMLNWGHPENAALPFGSVKPAWGNPTVENVRTEMAVLPCIGIARTDGLRLKALLEKGPVRVRMSARAEDAWREVKFTTGELDAEGNGDFVLVGGHQDSWPGPQATDNAAGNAVMLELARVFARHRAELRRGLLFGFWIGHETGTMISSSWFVDHHWDRLREHAVAYLQIDQPACVGTSIWHTGSPAEMRRFHQGVEARLLGALPYEWHRIRKTGDSSLFGIGVPMIYAHTGFTKEELKATANATLGWWHHSLENTIDKVDWGLMALHLRVYAGYLWELATAPILPYEFVSVATQFADRIQQLYPQGRWIGLTGTMSAAAALEDAARQLDQVATTWARRYREEGLEDDEPAEILNACLKRLSRLLIPIGSTAKGTYGQDTYSYTPQDSMIPPLFQVPRLGNLAEGEERWLLEGHLVRERNRVTDALVDACFLVEQTLARLA